MVSYHILCFPVLLSRLHSLTNHSLAPAVPGGAQLHVVKSAPHLLMYAESGVANRMVFRFLSVALKLKPDANRPVSIFASN